MGAGGTARAAAYVAKKLGLQSIYFNRTPSKAEELAQAFGGTVTTTLDSVADVLGDSSDGRILLVVSTLPASSEFVLPEWLLGTKPIVFDVNYKPYYTKLLRQAEEAECIIIRGSEMLWEQGVGQFELWTGRTAPYGVMKQIVLQNCQETVGSSNAAVKVEGSFE